MAEIFFDVVRECSDCGEELNDCDCGLFDEITANEADYKPCELCAKNPDADPYYGDPINCPNCQPQFGNDDDFGD
jgi:hypothetical protein